MPKARRSSYTMALEIKVIAEAKAVGNNSEIARDYGLSEPWCDAREETRRLFLLASLRCLQNVQKWAVSSVPNRRTRESFSQQRDQIFYS